MIPPPPSPSIFSPVGDSRSYSVALDEDELIDLSCIGRGPLTPDLNVWYRRSSATNRSRSRWNTGGGDDCDGSDHHNHNMDDENDDDDADQNRSFITPSRFPLDSDLPTPLLGHNHHHHQHSRHPKLNGLNYLNVITYLVNVFVSYGIGYAGLFGVLPTRWDISKHFETLVTPAEYAYYLWAPILVFEAIFATAQLFPHYRARPIIQQGTGFFFFYTCIIQTAWTLFFAFELFILSFVAVVAALLCLASLLASQYYCNVAVVQGRNSRYYYYNYDSSRGAGGGGGRYKSMTEYWLFRFPFYLHCGWLIMCSVVQFSILFRYYTGDVGSQLAADIVALGVMLPAATFFLTGQPSGPDLVIPLVIIWSYISIGLELNHPSDALQDLYGPAVITAFRIASYIFAGTVVIMLIPRVVIWIAQDFCTIQVVDLMAYDDDDEDDNDDGHDVVGVDDNGNDSHFYYRFSFSNNNRQRTTASTREVGEDVQVEDDLVAGNEPEQKHNDDEQTSEELV